MMPHLQARVVGGWPSPGVDWRRRHEGVLVQQETRGLQRLLLRLLLLLLLLQWAAQGKAGPFPPPETADPTAAPWPLPAQTGGRH